MIIECISFIPKYARRISSPYARVGLISLVSFQFLFRQLIAIITSISYEMSFYRQTITPLVKYLKTLSLLLDKGVKFADTRGMQHEEILSFKLAPDMKP